MTDLESPFAACTPAPYEGVLCPFGCKEAVIDQRGVSSTLVGWFGGPDENPNHHTMGCQCGSCGNHFAKHWVIRDKSAWYTAVNLLGNPVILGIPTCCETNYTLPCPCGGKLQHSVGSSYGTTWTLDVPDEPHYWSCIACERRAPDHRHGVKFMNQPWGRHPLDGVANHFNKSGLATTYRHDPVNSEGVVAKRAENVLHVKRDDKWAVVVWSLFGFTLTGTSNMPETLDTKPLKIGHDRELAILKIRQALT